MKVLSECLKIIIITLCYTNDWVLARTLLDSPHALLVQRQYKTLEIGGHMITTTQWLGIWSYVPQPPMF